MTNGSCRGFIACSSNHNAKVLAEDIARGLRRRLRELHGVDGCEVRPWFFDDDLMGKMLLPALMKKADNVDFAVVVLHPDDPAIRGDQDAILTRDNVVFEMGLFISKLGLERVFVFRPSTSTVEFRAPTDIDGLIAYTYDAPETAGPNSAGDCRRSWQNAVEDHCSNIANRLKDLSASSDKPQVRSNYVIYGIEEHMNLLRDFADCKTAEFNFMGTMVGFSYVIPPQLSKFVVEQECVDYEVNVIGSRYILNFPAAEKRLFIFPYAFVLKTIKGILAACEQGRLQKKSHLNIIFNVYYHPHDIIDAICSVSPDCWFQSQGLDPKQIDIYLEHQRDRYVGIRLPVENNHVYRYMDIIRRRRLQSERQTWELEVGSDGSKQLDISGCVFLDYKDGRLKTRDPSKSKEESFFGEDVKTFAETRYQALTGLVPSIGEIDEKIRRIFPNYFE